jgi:hypothetical protein
VVKHSIIIPIVSTRYRRPGYSIADIIVIALLVVGGIGRKPI